MERLEERSVRSDSESLGITTLHSRKALEIAIQRSSRAQM